VAAPRAAGQLYGAFALSHACGVLSAINTAAAAAAPRVERVLTASDLVTAGLQNALSENSDEVVLVEVGGVVSHAGARLALVLATTREAAESAARLVTAAIAPPAQPVVTDFDGAIQQKRFFEQAAGKLQVGDAAAAMQHAEVVVSGSVQCGHQYHFYMETQTAAAQCDGDGSIIVHVCAASDRTPSPNRS
jgi:xanthine dehydrogenase molybdopterin-binding subunit B